MPFDLPLLVRRRRRQYNGGSGTVFDFTAGTLDPRVSFERGSTATFTDINGVITLAPAGQPRFDYFPDMPFPRGLLLEGERTNILLNSSIIGTSLATQSVTVAAVPYTLSFYGSGQIVLSGAASATVTGVGVYPDRKTFTFTPTAGTLTLTVTGTVQYAQLEAGRWASSFIPTGGTAATRGADSATITGANFSSWYRDNAGTFVVGAETAFGTTTQTPSILMVTDDLEINYQTLYVDATTRNISYTGRYTDFELDFVDQSYNLDSLPGRQYDLGSEYAFPWAVYGQAAAYSTNDFANSGNGSAPSLDTSGVVPINMTKMIIGPNNGNFGYGGWFGWIREFSYFNSRLSDAELQTQSYAVTISPTALELNFLQQQYYAGEIPYSLPTSLSADFIDQTYVVG